jgi:hypothetical protein
MPKNVMLNSDGSNDDVRTFTAANKGNWSEECSVFMVQGLPWSAVAGAATPCIAWQVMSCCYRLTYYLSYCSTINSNEQVTLGFYNGCTLCLQRHARCLWCSFYYFKRIQMLHLSNESLLCCCYFCRRHSSHCAYLKLQHSQCYAARPTSRFTTWSSTTGLLLQHEKKLQVAIRLPLVEALLTASAGVA